MGKSIINIPIYRPRLLYLMILWATVFSFNVSAQIDSTVTLTYDFNNHRIQEVDNKTDVRAHDALLTYDRFGNKESAVQLYGTTSCYLNLGTSPLLKSPSMSISMWIKINNRMYIGKGNDAIPILATKNGPGMDYINAFIIVYDYNSERLSTSSTRDSLHEVVVPNNDTIIYNKWYHLVAVCDNKFMAFYIDGKLIGKAAKNFETKFLETDSMVIGHSASAKNLRMMRGVVDDIKIFHRSLSASEVETLYNAPNPNESQKILNLIYKFAAVVLGLVLIIIGLVIRNRRALKKQREELELENRISDLELKAVKAQMNPHFISNCLAAIQDLNYNQETEKAGLYIARFSFFLRQILNYSDENYVSIQQEIEVIRLFIELEQLRFKNGFRFNVLVDEAMNSDDLMIPSLITQPFIENAIWHGLLPLNGMREPELNIRFLMTGGYPHIEIEDNGVGRDHDKKPSRKRKGTQLMMDKMETLNRLTKSKRYKIEIVDLKDEKGNNCGTKIIISLDIIKE